MYNEKEIKYKKRKNNNFNLQKQKTIKIPNFINKINWKQLLSKILGLIIVLTLIIFIIFRINKSNKNDKQDLDNNANKIINASIKYFNTENVPKNIGDSTSFSLDEIIEKKLVKIINKEKCNNKNSYIVLSKKNDDNYQLKLHLSCSKKEKTIEKKLICPKNCQIKK